VFFTDIISGPVQERGQEAHGASLAQNGHGWPRGVVKKAVGLGG
jgi:hypothetical protein